VAIGTYCCIFNVSFSSKIAFLIAVALAMVEEEKSSS